MIRLFLLIALFVILGCSNSKLPYMATTYESLEQDDGMILVRSAGNETILGTNSRKALPSVRPKMRVKFTYDYYIGKREVTYGEYGDVLGKEYDSEILDQPVVNVTFFDAALYANALSKKMGLDTVYTYTDAIFDGSGNCVSLLDFTTHFDVEAYRLPTEAEWVYVARQNWNAKCVDTLDRPCNFIGGVKEWVNDWMGALRSAVYKNYVGAFNGGLLNTRILKGGSFRDNPDDVRVYNRTDVYQVTADMKADYVGFRLAYGIIPNPTMTDNKGFAVHDDVDVSISSDAFRSMFGTMNGKIVFRNESSGTLTYVNFISGNPVVYEIDDSLDVYHPAVSPDGKFVAFCSLPEGVAGESNIYVRSLDVTSSVVRKLEQVHGSIPRWRVLENGDTVIVFVDYNGNNKNEAAYQSATTWQVGFAQGMFKKLTRVASGAYNGGISEDWRLAVSGARMLRAKRADSGMSLLDVEQDEFWYGGEQACNASLALDGTKRTLFLDFGGYTGQAFAGRKYGTHEMLLVVDSLGKLIQGIPAPASYSFDNTEWTNRKDMVIGTLVDNEGVHSKIVAINLKDSSVTDLVEGVDITYPDLWMGNAIPVEEENALSPDSAGVYMFAGGSMEMSLYRYKMELLWRYRDSADVVILGSSRPLSGVDPTIINSFFAVNLSQTPNSMAQSHDFFERYVLGNVTNLRHIVVSLDIDFWWKVGDDDNLFYDRYKLYPGYVYDENHNYWKDDRDVKILEFTMASVGTEEADKIMFHRGLYSTTGQGWDDSPTILYDSTWSRTDRKKFYSNLGVLEDMIKLAAENGVDVFGVIFPQNPAYANTGSYGRYGIRRSDAPELIAEIAALEKKYANFHLMDENKMGEHDYTPSMAANDDHLNLFGSRKLSGRLNTLLQKYR